MSYNSKRHENTGIPLLPSFPKTPQQAIYQFESESESSPKKGNTLRNSSASRLQHQGGRHPNVCPLPQNSPLVRRNSQSSSTVNCLRNELMDIRTEVNKMLGGGDESLSNNFASRETQDNFDQRSSGSRYERPQNQTDRVQVGFLREELTLLRRKYQDRKMHHKEEKAHLLRKVHFLEQMVSENQKKVEAYKAQINMEIYAIERQLIENANNGNAVCAQKMQQQLQQLEKLFEDEKSETERAKQEVRRLEEFAESQRRERQIMRDRVMNLEDQMEIMREQLSNSKRIMHKVNREVQTQYQQPKEDQYSIQQLKEAHQKAIQLIYLEKKQNDEAVQEQIRNLIEQLNEKQQQIKKSIQQNVDLTKKLMSQKSFHKQKHKQFESFKDLLKKAQEQIKNLKQSNVKFEEQISKTANDVANLKEQNIYLQQLVKQLNEQAENLRKELKKKQTILWKKQNQSIAVAQSFKTRIMKLAHQQQCLAQDLERKSQISELQDREIQQLNKLYKDTVQQLKQTTHDFNEIKDDYKAQLKESKLQIQNLQLLIEKKEIGFQTQLEKLNKQIQQKTVKQKQIKTEIQNENEQGKFINKLDLVSNNSSVQLQIQSLRSQLQVQKRTSSTLITKVKYLLDELKKKDQYVQKNFVHQKLSQDQQTSLNNFFKEYSIEFPIQQVKTKLNSELRAIISLQGLNKALSEQILLLKQAQKQPSTSLTLAHQSRQSLSGNPSSHNIIGFQSFMDTQFD